MQLREEKNVIGMLGVCETTVVTEYFNTKLLHYVWRHGKDMEIRELVAMSIDAAKGLQVRVIPPDPREAKEVWSMAVVVSDVNSFGERCSNLPL